MTSDILEPLGSIRPSDGWGERLSGGHPVPESGRREAVVNRGRQSPLKRSRTERRQPPKSWNESEQRKTISYRHLSRHHVVRSRKPIASEAWSAEESPHHGRITGPVRFINRLLDVWRLEPEYACALLGFERSESAYVTHVLRGHATLQGRDAKDRIAHLFQIRRLLWALFRDETVENEWLREPRAVLKDKTPMDLLMEGSMENLLLVREVVELTAGR